MIKIYLKKTIPPKKIFLKKNDNAVSSHRMEKKKLYQTTTTPFQAELLEGSLKPSEGQTFLSLASSGSQISGRGKD